MRPMQSLVLLHISIVLGLFNFFPTVFLSIFVYNDFMFNSLTGIISGKFPNTLYLENNGIEWNIYISSASLDSLPTVGNEAKVYIWTYVREDALKLYGFANVKERNLFLDLLKVDGVGAKGAMKILSNINADLLIAALDDGNTGAIEAVSGIGKKTAAKIMLTLKGKLTLDTDSLSVQRVKQSKYADLIRSLCDMGYDRRNVEEVIVKLENDLGKDEKFSALANSAKEDMLFRRALVELA